MTPSLLIKNGTVVNADGRQRADVLIEEGVIQRLEADIEAGDAARVVDAGGALVVPGGIDAHTHFAGKFMGADTADDFLSGGRSAIAGGITTHIDMCFQAPGGSLADAAERWHAEAAGRAVCDYGLHIVITEFNDSVGEEVAEMVAAGYPSFKLFMAYRGLALDDDALVQVMQLCAGHGAVPVVHAESFAATERLTEDLVAQGRNALKWHPFARPVAAEAEAVERAIRLAEVAGSPLYVVHVSSEEALAAVARARLRGQTVDAETEPHYLSLTGDVYEQPSNEAIKFLCSPPIRGHADQEALWAGLASRQLSTVASDHCPITAADRRRIGGNSFARMPNGVGSIEYVRPLLWSEGVRAGRITAERFVELTATAPASLFGLESKGRIAVGLDADVVVWNPEERWVIRRSDGQSALDYCIFEGREVVGRAAVTVSGGEVVWEHGRFVGEPGSGRFIQRAPRGAVDLPANRLARVGPPGR